MSFSSIAFYYRSQSFRPFVRWMEYVHMQNSLLDINTLHVSFPDLCSSYLLISPQSLSPLTDHSNGPNTAFTNHD